MSEEARTLADLGLVAEGGRAARVTGLALDSRAVRQGSLFAALPGTRAHGAAFVPAALAAGAAAVLTDPAGARDCRAAVAAAGAALVLAGDARAALARTAARWFGAQPATVVAVTGTNGKTSVASFARQLWEGAGLAAASIGTTGVEGAFAAPMSHTTPDALTLHRLLAAMAAAGVTHAAMEASSHGLDQRRLDGVRLAAAAFTNLTQDHLDYHPDMEAYYAAKAGLFERLLPAGAPAVVNLDGAHGARMAAAARAAGHPLVTVGRAEGADLRILAQSFRPAGQTLRFAVGGAARQAELALVGGFQAENALVALGLVLAAGGAAPEAVLDGLGRLATVRGRMQHVATRASGAPLFVDYAHTPDAIATALAALRPHVLGRIVIVFGAGGDRDRGKRPLMGQAAAAGADLCIVTDDNPRSEEPAAIRAAVLAGCPGAVEVGDRAEAILRGAAALGPGDALLLAGKGHETGQTVGGTVYPFDDAEQASLAVAALEGREP